MLARPGTLPVRVHRLYPWDKWFVRGFCCCVALGTALYAWPARTLSLACLVGAAGFFIWLCFAQKVLLEATSLGLRIVKQGLLPLPRRIDMLRSREIRRIRYRLEKVPNRDSDTDGTTDVYILDLVTTDSRIITLMRSENFTFDPHLGHRLAATLGVAYEEHLDDA